MVVRRFTRLGPLIALSLIVALTAVASATTAPLTAMEPHAGQMCNRMKMPPKGFACVKNKQGQYRLAACTGAGACTPQAAVSAFIKAVQSGNGTAACALLTDAEQRLFVLNSADIQPALDNNSCASIVQSFKAAIGTKSALLSGTLSNVNFVGAQAGGMWIHVGTSGQQAVLLTKTGKGWLIDQGSNDFPTALLHFFD
jgi:hypothetical protein